MNENNDTEMSSLDDFFDDDPTDEFPALNLRDIDPQLADQFDNQPVDDTGEIPITDHTDSGIPAAQSESSARTDHTNQSLRQMELEIQALQTKWYNIESDVRSRDEAIELLEAELLTQKAAADDLRAELDESRTRLAKANEACARLAAENAEQLSTTDCQQQRLHAVEAELVEQKIAADGLREKLDESREELANAHEASAKLLAENLDQQRDAEAFAESLSAVEDALLRKTGEAEALQANLDESRKGLAALATSSEKLAADNQERLRAMAENAEQLSQLQTERVELRTQVDDLSNYIAGRRSDWDAWNIEAALHREVNLGLQQAIAAKSEALALQKQENAALLVEIDKQRRESALLRSALSKEEDTLAEEQTLRRELQEKLAAKSKYTDALETANTELMELTSSQRIMKDQLDRKNRELDRLNLAVTRLEDEHAETAATLKKQQEVIQHMENEVRAKLEAITVIGRKAQRNFSKPASIHRMDVSRSKNSAGRPARREKKSHRFMIALNDQQNKEYLIEHGTMTIGRGPGNDIRLRHHFISRNHAQILTDANGSVIEDLGSKNGILVNAEPVNRRRLQNGDLVDIGAMQFKFIDPVNHTGGHKAH
jgi:chromosome segregation ATPase